MMGDRYISKDIPEWILDDEEPATPIRSRDQIILAPMSKQVS